MNYCSSEWRLPHGSLKRTAISVPEVRSSLNQRSLTTFKFHIYRYRPSVQSLYYRRYQSDSNAVTASLFYYRTSIAYQRTKLNKVGLTLKPASQSESKADCHRSLMTDCYCVMNLHFGQLTDFGKLESGKRANAEARKMPSNLIVCWVLFLGSREEREGNHKNKIQLKQNKPFSRST